MPIFGSRLRNRKFRKRTRLFIGDIRERRDFLFTSCLCVYYCVWHVDIIIYCVVHEQTSASRVGPTVKVPMLLLFFFFMWLMINAYLHLSFRLHILCINTIIIFYEFFVDISLTNDIRYIMIIIWSFYNISSPFCNMRYLWYIYEYREQTPIKQSKSVRLIIFRKIITH